MYLIMKIMLIIGVVNLLVRNFSCYFLCSALTVFVILFFASMGLDFSENGGLEILQLLVLLVEWIIFWVVAYKTNHSTQAASMDRLLYMIPLLLFLIIGREMSWGRIWEYTQLYSPVIKIIWISLFVIGFSWIGYRMIGCTWKLGVFIRKYQSLCYFSLASLGWMIAADIFDKDLFNMGLVAMYYEESLELVAYTNLLIPSYILLKKLSLNKKS